MNSIELPVSTALKVHSPGNITTVKKKGFTAVFVVAPAYSRPKQNLIPVAVGPVFGSRKTVDT
ncbi:MAG: hypothetical protein BMS9Abin33_0574 [Gammaproteobacteria bacterium]|nr:MAG: hypothetical protein BMS9Abin33_0574 [Gammaproteobacteria bacterium]